MSFAEKSPVCSSLFKAPEVYANEYNPNAKQTVILLHGLTKSAKAMSPLAKLLARKYRVLNFDMLGHGKYFDETPEDINVIDYQDNIRNIKNYIEEKGLKNVIIIGHSYGGAIAFELARKLSNPPSSVVLLTPYVQRLDKLFIRMVRNSLPLMFSNFSDALSESYVKDFIVKKYREKLLEEMGKTSSQLTEEEKEYIKKKIKLTIATIKGIRVFDLLDYSKDLVWNSKVPITIIGADQDDLVPAEQLSALAERLHDKKVHLQFEKDLNHYFPLKEPQKTFELIEKALSANH